MACTASVTTTGLNTALANNTTQLTNIVTQLTTMNTNLGNIKTDLDSLVTAAQTLAAATALGDLAQLLTGSGSPLATLAGAVISNVLQIARAAGGSPSADAAAIVAALVGPTAVSPLADRIAKDQAVPVAERLVSGLPFDSMTTDIGAIADRISPLPTDSQCDAADLAWSTNPSTDNIADQVAGITFACVPYDL